MNTVEKLTEIFKMFPGIGERQAKRFVYFLMSRNQGSLEELSNLLLQLKKETRQCNECFRFFSLKNETASTLCNICKDPNIDSSTLLIIERDSDLESIQKSGIYNGKYFVLGGLVPIVEKNTTKAIRLNDLKNKTKNENLKEIILAFSLSPQGDHTDFYLRNELKNITEEKNIKISSLGRGLSTGTELEYSDNDTIKHALQNRQ
ncbi:MAG: toprim domain-containing protein [Candidatus Pacebacteria bacterium]|nr:toprim domain-containing protein [Candidatus Paceibacterota bacterium]MCF7862892.1 toprim domain-containing protein [Candidatus Paceibacterota bacterium]